MPGRTEDQDCGTMAAGKRVVVIGAGIVGISTALWLQRDGHQVVVIDPEPPGRGASFGNAGCFSPGSIVPPSGPGVLRQVPGWLLDPTGPLALRWRYLPLAAPWLMRFVRAGAAAKVIDQARAMAQLLAPAYDCIEPLLRDAGAECLLKREGSLVVYSTRAGWEGSQRGWALRRRNGVTWDELGPEELQELDPALATGQYRGAFLPGNGHTTDPYALLSLLAAAFVRAGGQVIPAAALGFAFEQDRLCAVQTSAGSFAASAAILAAGAHSRKLARALGDHVPLESERGYHLTLPSPQVAPRYPTLSAEGRFVVTPMAMGVRLTGTVELAGLRAPPDWRRAHMLLPMAQKLLPGLGGAGGTVWMGHRPSMPDFLPVIGRSRRSADVLYAFGHGHLGLTAAASTGRLASQILTGKTPLIDPSPFAASRFRGVSGDAARSRTGKVT